MPAFSVGADVPAQLGPQMVTGGQWSDLVAGQVLLTTRFPAARPGRWFNAEAGGRGLPMHGEGGTFASFLPGLAVLSGFVKA